MIPSVVALTTLCSACQPRSRGFVLNPGQPFYGWLAQPANLWTARFSGLQGPNSTYNS